MIRSLNNIRDIVFFIIIAKIFFYHSPQLIIDYKNNCDDTKVSFKVIMQKTVIDDLIKNNEMNKKLKLTSTINTTNMHVFDAECKIRKINSPEEIIYRFYNNHFLL